MLKDLGIVTERFYDYYDQEYFSKRNLGRGLYFSKQQYGSDVTAPDVMRGFGAAGGGNIEESVGRYPVTEASKAAFLRLLGEERDYLPDMNREEKIALLRRISYTDFLQQHARMPKEVTDILRDGIRGFWGVGWDSLSALEGYRLGMPATAKLGIGELTNEPPGRDEPYIFHFPDGNAGVAGAGATAAAGGSAGHSMEDLVLPRLDYELLDRLASKKFASG
jgi:spermidine dehydrogenase